MAISKQTRKLLDERKQMIRRLAHPHYNGDGLGDYPCEMCGFSRNHAIHTQPVENTKICRKA
jgi:hypothetical protein